MPLALTGEGDKDLFMSVFIPFRTIFLKREKLTRKRKSRANTGKEHCKHGQGSCVGEGLSRCFAYPRPTPRGVEGVGY